MSDPELSPRMARFVEALARWQQERDRAEGAAELLLKWLALRFGPTSPELERRVRRASLAELHVMADRVVEGKTLDEVLS